ncbi:hypothetical protein LCGC14_0420640 [marine sediment metagenome]|uniref:Uncharacterized protein n=1 Tax=marine sediment metagenome TaxID=412755 RepID=A0A0F9SR33_9ZZZZ
MDTTETYIKMCDCEEIQNTKRYKAFSDTSPSAEALILDNHDFYGVHEGGQYYPDSTIGSHNVWNATVFGYVSNIPQFGCAVQSDRRITYKVDEIIWLPCQAQLQEMVKYFHNLPPAEYSSRGQLEVFWQFVDDNWHDYLWAMSDEPVSMEQLWLAFVIKEKHNKVWDGDTWQHIMKK